MNLRGVENILPGKPFYVNIMNFTPKPVNLLKFMIVAYASNAPKCVVHVRVDKLFTMGSGSQVVMQCDLKNTVNAVHYKPPERRDNQVDRLKDLKRLKHN